MDVLKILNTMRNKSLMIRSFYKAEVVTEALSVSDSEISSV